MSIRSSVTKTPRTIRYVPVHELVAIGMPNDYVLGQVVILEYINNVRATFHTNCNSALPERSLRIVGVKGALTGTSSLARRGSGLCLLAHSFVTA